MKERVVVTGLGAITPIGNGVDAFWSACKRQEVGIGEITKFDSSEYKVHIAAEVKDFDAKDHMDAKLARRMEAFCQFAVAAAAEAVRDAGIRMEDEDPFRVGVCLGTGIGSLQIIESEYVKLLEKGPNRVNPLMIPMMIGNMASGNVAIQFGMKGKNMEAVSACATGTHSIGEAFRSIQNGEVDAMVAGGTEAPISKISLAGFAAMQALSTSTDPLAASLPFDKNRGGFVMGEGAGVVMLESLSHAQRRNAKIYAELVGYGATCDAYHITSPLEDGSGAAKAMELAIRDAGVTPDQVDYINAHGTGTKLNDLYETRAIKSVFGEAAHSVKINSTKSMIGHLLGGAGGVEFVACVKSIEDGYVHATVGSAEPDDELDLNYMMGGGEETTVNYALSNSLGFGGHNASLLVKKWEG